MGLPGPEFDVGTAWDGTTPHTRPNTGIFKRADGEIGNRLSSEIIALEELLKNVVVTIGLLENPGAANSMLGVKNDQSDLEYKTLVGGVSTTISHVDDTITFDSDIPEPTVDKQILQANSSLEPVWKNDLDISYSVVDASNSFALKLDYFPSTTIDATQYYRAFSLVTQPSVSSGKTNSGYVTTGYFSTLGVDSYLDGTLASLTGFSVTYGCYSGTGILNEANGIAILPYHKGGTIDLSRAIWINQEKTGGTATSAWAIRSDMRAQSYFARGMGIGSDTIPKANGDYVLWFGDNVSDPTMGASTAGVFAKTDTGGTGYVEIFAVNSNGTVSRVSSGSVLEADLDVKTYAIYTSTTNGKITLTPHGSGGIELGNKVLATRYGEVAQAAGNFAAYGDAQTSILVAKATTTDAATSTEMFLGSSDRMTLVDGETWFFTIHVIARETDQLGRSCAYEVKGVIERSGDTTTLVDSTNTDWGPSGTPFGTVTVTADDTNESLKIAVTGVASTTIRWVARVETTQVRE
jgi:hypothetical protein